MIRGRELSDAGRGERGSVGLSAAACVLVGVLCAGVWAGGLLAVTASNVLVVANTKAEGSVKIAEHYAERRGIPVARILKIEASEKEEIARAEYEESMLGPIAKVVKADRERNGASEGAGLADAILCVVLTRGVPLKIKASDGKAATTHRDWASVDGELALLLRGGHALEGWIESPFFNSERALTVADQLLMVARLDGPTVEGAIGLVDKAIVAEQLGAVGESFLDTRGMTKPDGYGERDIHMRTVGDAWKAMGVAFEHDDTGPVIDVSLREPLLHYYGWYAGNPKAWKGRPKFRTGAIGVHLHSFSASTVRDVRHNWVAPMLDWGVTATYGTVYEPFTVGFPYEGVFWDRLARGFGFGMAGMMANRLLSWQAVFVGDPLYTPYPKDRGPGQIEARTKLLAALGEKSPEAGLEGREREAMRVLLDWCAEVERAVAQGDGVGLEAYGGLLGRVQGWGLEEAIAKRLEAVDKAAKRHWNTIKAALRKDPADSAAYLRAVEDWRGLSVHGELVRYRVELVKMQEREAAKHLKAAQAAMTKEATTLKAWQAATAAAAFTLCESGIAAAKLRDELEKEKKALLEEQANKALESHAAKYTKIGAKALTDKDKAAIRELVATHPACEQRTALEKLLA